MPLTSRGDNQSSRKPRKFLFINKDSQSTSLSNERGDPDVLLKIGQHVQSTRTYEERRRKPVSASASALVGWAQAPAKQTSSQRRKESELAKTISCSRCGGRCRQGRLCPLYATPPVQSFTANPVDPFNCSAVPMDSRNQRILQYFATAWIPPGSEVGSNLAGFTIMGLRDNELSLDIIKSSLPTKVHTHALLAASACRMKYISGLQFERDDAPEVHTVQAIQALRKYVEAAEPVTDQVILDLFFLSLAEFYTKNHLGSRVHYHIMKQFVINLGGFAKLEPFVAWLVLSCDYLLAASTTTPPVFDFTRDSRLLGIPLLTTADRVETAILRSILHLEPRMQVLIKDNISLAQVIAHIRQLPQPVQASITSLVDKHSTTVYRFITMPLQVGGQQTPEQLEQARIADRLVSRTRRLAFAMWLWHSSLGFVTDFPISTDANLQQIFFLMSAFAAEMRASLEWAENILVKTKCTVRNDLLLWLNALGILISPTDLNFYTPRFVRAAEVMRVYCEEQLGRALSKHLPLDRIGDSSLSLLYHLLAMEQGFASEGSTPSDIDNFKGRDTPSTTQTPSTQYTPSTGFTPSRGYTPSD